MLIPETTKHLLSKSTFVRGCQCTKALWLNKFQPKLKDVLSEAQRAIFTQGTEVGVLAQNLFPGGKDASPPTPFEYLKSVSETYRFIEQQHPVIYEAAFQFQGVLAALDILVKKNSKWHAFEVKSSTGIKEQFILDAALQYYVITNAGLALEDFSIVYINNEYKRKGKLEIEKLFKAESVLDKVLDLQPYISKKAEELKAVCKLQEMPANEIGQHCFTPYPCDFMGYCWNHVPSNSVFDLRGNGGFETAMTLYNKGILRMEDIPKDFVIGAQQSTQIEVAQSGEPVKLKDELDSFLTEIQYPIFHLDFETFASAVPDYEGCRPYQQIPFQYSIHIQRSRGADPEALSFLAEAGIDPRKGFIESLIRDLGTKGTVMVYNSSFEKLILKELALAFPEFQNSLDAIASRILDLMHPFRKKHYYVPAMKGSYSIKDVLPALVPELNYESLEINNGALASVAFYTLKFEKDQEKIKKVRADLIRYCGMDTFAMVKILEKIEHAVG